MVKQGLCKKSLPLLFLLTNDFLIFSDKTEMAYSFQRVEEALDSLGLDYTEGVPFKITEKYKIDYDFSDVSYLLHRPDPAVLLDDVAYDCSLEHKVLEDWEKRRVEREEKLRLRKERIEKYEKERAEELELKRQEEEFKY